MSFNGSILTILSHNLIISDSCFLKIWHRGKYYLSEGDYQAAADDISRAISIAKDSGIKDLPFFV